jgi:1,4-alpha-glucan branching enzyme
VIYRAEPASDDPALAPAPAALPAEFNGWQPVRSPMAKLAPGIWRYIVRDVKPGRYRYKFLVDGTQWIPYPDNSNQEPDGYGGVNSIVVAH